MRHPLILLAIAFIGGILLASKIPAAPSHLLGLAGVLTLTAVFWRKVRASLIVPMVVLAGWADFNVHTAVLSPNDLRVLLATQEQLGSVRGVLKETPAFRVIEQEDKSSVRTLARLDVTNIRLKGMEWVPAEGTIAVSTPGELTNVFGGQPVEVT